MRTDHEYLKITPTSDQYQPSTIRTALDEAYNTFADSRPTARTAQRRPGTIEFLVVSRAESDQAAFYLHCTPSTGYLARNFPYRRCGFDVERVSLSLEEIILQEVVGLPTGTDPTSILPTTESEGDGEAFDLATVLTDAGIHPLSYRVGSRGTRAKAWVESRLGLTEAVRAGAPSKAAPYASGKHPLEPVIELLPEIDGLACYLVRAHPAPRLARRAERVKADPRSWFQKALAELVDGLFVDAPARRGGPRRGRRGRWDRSNAPAGYGRSGNRSRPGRRPAPRQRATPSSLARHPTHREGPVVTDPDSDPDPKPLWVANVWLVAFPRSTDERLYARRVFDEIVGDFRGYDHVKYKLAHSGESGLVQGLLPSSIARRGECQRLRELLSGRVQTPLLTRDALGRKLSPDVVCSSDELAALAAVPSTEDLARSVRERVDHRPGSATLDTQFTPAQREYYVNEDDPVESDGPQTADTTSTGDRSQTDTNRGPYHEPRSDRGPRPAPSSRGTNDADRDRAGGPQNPSDGFARAAEDVVDDRDEDSGTDVDAAAGGDGGADGDADGDGDASGNGPDPTGR